MSANLVEFLKVLTIVVTWSTGILVGRHYMLSIDTSRDEREDEREDEVELERNNSELTQFACWHSSIGRAADL